MIITKRFKTATLLILSAITFHIAHSQELSLKQIDSAKKTRAENIYLELYGPGLLYSANYDTRFSNSRSGIGIRVGAGFFKSDGLSVVTVPVQINYLLGKRNHFFEVGAGASYVSANFHDIFNNNSNQSGSTILGTITAGYRSQPIDGGFTFRGGLNLLFNSEIFTPWPYLSFGYTF